ncbi:hypothetical protein RRG08_013137 [Elysia crispata]|uniref:Uncharacterized protein n=1 Tax=Elysia crispata TaxID=231223 RepID=A0AAE1DRD5_9GAST|nr:hypothetical protein RRG08_013137 [Elysia crispata]
MAEARQPRGRSHGLTEWNLGNGNPLSGQKASRKDNAEVLFEQKLTIFQDHDPHQYNQKVVGSIALSVVDSNKNVVSSKISPSVRYN